MKDALLFFTIGFQAALPNPGISVEAIITKFKKHFKIADFEMNTDSQVVEICRMKKDLLEQLIRVEKTVTEDVTEVKIIKNG